MPFQAGLFLHDQAGLCLVPHAGQGGGAWRVGLRQEVPVTGGGSGSASAGAFRHPRAPAGDAVIGETVKVGAARPRASWQGHRPDRRRGPREGARCRPRPSRPARRTRPRPASGGRTARGHRRSKGRPLQGQAGRRFRRRKGAARPRSETAGRLATCRMASPATRPRCRLKAILPGLRNRPPSQANCPPISAPARLTSPVAAKGWPSGRAGGPTRRSARLGQSTARPSRRAAQLATDLAVAKEMRPGQVTPIRKTDPSTRSPSARSDGKWLPLRTNCSNWARRRPRPSVKSTGAQVGFAPQRSRSPAPAARRSPRPSGARLRRQQGPSRCRR